MPSSQVKAVFHPAFGDEIRSDLHIVHRNKIERTFGVFFFEGCWQIVEDMLGSHGFRPVGVWTFLDGAWEMPLQVMEYRKTGAGS